MWHFCIYVFEASCKLISYFFYNCAKRSSRPRWNQQKNVVQYCISNNIIIDYIVNNIIFKIIPWITFSFVFSILKSFPKRKVVIFPIKRKLILRFPVSYFTVPAVWVIIFKFQLTKYLGSINLTKLSKNNTSLNELNHLYKCILSNFGLTYFFKIRRIKHLN